MGSIALLLAEEVCRPETCDLYLRHGFANASAVSRRLRMEHLARNVIDVVPGRGASLDLRGSSAALSSESARRTAMGGFVPDAAYDIVLCSYPYDTVTALVEGSPAARLVLFDDGLGSYEGDILHDNGGAGLPKATCLYVSAPKLCHSTASEDIRKLPFSLGNGRLVDTLQRIFAIDYARLAPYHAKRCIYLTQPVDANEARRGVDAQVLAALRRHAQEVIVRPHPRDTSQHDARIAYDESEIPWELACRSGIVDERSVLVAGCSTAQVMPRILLGIEPHVVFTAELYAPVTKASIMDVWRGLMDTIASSYAHRDRIHRPHTPKELSALLDELL